MRSTLFVILAFLVSAGGFVAYWKLQKPITRLLGQGPPPVPQTLNRKAPAVSGVGEGEHPYSKTFDKEGRLASRFRAADVRPTKAGPVHVTNVESEFYQYLKPSLPQYPQGRVQLVRIEGKEGDMEMQDSSPTGRGMPMQKGTTGAPKRGRLNDVVIRLYRDIADRQAELRSPAAGGPMLVLTTNNVSFDNESFEVATEAYTEADGTLVAADQVPIHVTGDYLFEGKGLKLRWNDVDGRLDYLEVAHGEKLVVKDPKALSGGDPDARRPKAAATALLDLWGMPVLLASADPNAAALAQPRPQQAAPPAKTPAGRKAASRDAAREERHGPQPPYRATFVNDVRISQGQEGPGEKELALADVMHVEFQVGQSKPATQPTTAPAAAPPAKPETPATAPAAPTTAPTTAPATQPADPDKEPVIVRWTGPMRIIPIEPTDPQPPPALKAGESVLHLLGTRAPVLLTRDTTKVRCASADYFSADGSAVARNSPQFPQVVMTQTPAAPAADGTPGKGGGQDATIVTETLVYSGTDRIAVLQGRGSARFGLKNTDAPSPATAPAQPMDVQWSKSARLYFAAGTKDLRDGMTLDQATVLGDVDVKHPQLALKSDALDLLFDKPTPKPKADGSPAGGDQPELRKLVATQGVWCDMKDQNGKQQTVESDRLEMETAAGDDGKRYPRLVNADGRAHAHNPEQDLTAEHIHLTLVPSKKAPATRPSTRPAGGGGIETAAVELETMTAVTGVRAVSADGAVATADQMYVVMKDGQPHARLVGKPVATVVDAKQNVITGPVVTVDPKQNAAAVEGPGTLRATRQDDPAAKPRPIDIAWVRGAELKGDDDRIFVHGGVTVVSTDEQGRKDTATAEEVTVELTAKPSLPATRPAARPGAALASAQLPATRPARGGPVEGLKMDVLKDKDVTAIVLDGPAGKDAVVLSDEKAADGSILRELRLNSARIRYEMQPAVPVAPVPGQLASAAAGPKPARLDVPGPGKMILRDHRPPEKPATRPAAGAAPDPGKNRGAMAFQWFKSLVYTEATRTAVMTGQVMGAYQSDDPNEPLSRLNADRVDITFAPRAAKPATPGAVKPAPTTRPAGEESLELQWMTATGNAVVSRAGSSLTADRIDYDPATGWVTATGSDRLPATFRGPTGAGNGSAGQIMWNLRTGDVRSTNLNTRGTPQPNGNNRVTPPQR